MGDMYQDGRRYDVEYGRGRPGKLTSGRHGHLPQILFRGVGLGLWRLRYRKNAIWSRGEWNVAACGEYGKRCPGACREGWLRWVRSRNGWRWVSSRYRQRGCHWCRCRFRCRIPERIPLFHCLAMCIRKWCCRTKGVRSSIDE